MSAKKRNLLSPITEGQFPILADVGNWTGAGPLWARPFFLQE